MNVSKLSQVLHEYYQQLDHQAVLCDQLQAAEEQIAVLRVSVDSPMRYPSQGVASYGGQHTGGGASDPTHTAACSHMAATAKMSQRLENLELRAADYRLRIAEIQEETAPIRYALSRLPEDDARLLDLRYRVRKSHAGIGAVLDITERTVRERLIRMEGVFLQAVEMVTMYSSN